MFLVTSFTSNATKVAESYNNLGSVYYNQRKYAEAETMFFDSLRIKKIILGEKHPDVKIYAFFLKLDLFHSI